MKASIKPAPPVIQPEDIVILEMTKAEAVNVMAIFGQMYGSGGNCIASSLYDAIDNLNLEVEPTVTLEAKQRVYAPGYGCFVENKEFEEW